MKKFAMCGAIVACLVLCSCTLNVSGLPTNLFGSKEKINHLNGLKLFDDAYIDGRKIVQIFDSFYLVNARSLQNSILYALHNDIDIIVLRMANLGGPAIVMASIIEMIEAAQRKGISFHAYGEMGIMSAAVPVFVMCNVRVLQPGASMLLHPMQNANYENASPGLKKLYDAWMNAYAKVVSMHSKLSADRVKQIMRMTKDVPDWKKPKDEDGNYPNKKIIDESYAEVFIGDELIDLDLVDFFGYFGMD